MKLDYERATDSLTVVFIDAPVEESDEIRPGVILDFDAEGRIVGMEFWMPANARTTRRSSFRSEPLESYPLGY